MRTLLAVLLLLVSVAATAGKRDPREVTLTRDGRYEIDNYILGGAEMTGYLGELHEADGVQGVVLQGKFTPEQDAKFADVAKKAGVKAYVRDGGENREAGPVSGVEVAAGEKNP